MVLMEIMRLFFDKDDLQVFIGYLYFLLYMLSKYLFGKLVLVYFYKMYWKLLRKFIDSFVYNENILIIICF